MEVAFFNPIFSIHTDVEIDYGLLVEDLHKEMSSVRVHFEELRNQYGDSRYIHGTLAAYSIDCTQADGSDPLNL